MYVNDILHVEQTSNKELSYVKSTSITLVDKTITKRIKLYTKQYCDINFNSIENKTSWKRKKLLLLIFS